VPAGLGANELFINCTYEAILTALNRAAYTLVPYHKKKTLSKFWWDQERKSLKDDAQSTHIIWIISAGKPRSGVIFQNRNKDKYKYQLNIKENKANEKLLFTNILQSCFTNSNALPMKRECTPSLILLILLGYASHRRASDQRAR